MVDPNTVIEGGKILSGLADSIGGNIAQTRQAKLASGKQLKAKKLCGRPPILRRGSAYKRYQDCLKDARIAEAQSKANIEKSKAEAEQYKAKVAEFNSSVEQSRLASEQARKQQNSQLLGMAKTTALIIGGLSLAGIITLIVVLAKKKK